MYHDTKSEARKNVERSDRNRASYYEMISSSSWGQMDHYDLCIDSSIGKEKTAQVICDYVEKVVSRH